MLDALDGKDAMLDKMQKINAGQKGLLDKVVASQSETNKQMKQLKQEVQQKDRSLADTVKGINAEQKTELNQALERSLEILRKDLQKKECELEKQMKKNCQNSIEEMLKSMKKEDQTLEQMNKAKKAAEERNRRIKKQLLELQHNTKQEGKEAMNRKAEEQRDGLGKRCGGLMIRPLKRAPGDRAWKTAANQHVTRVQIGIINGVVGVPVYIDWGNAVTSEGA
eukprot:gene7000-12999_t